MPLQPVKQHANSASCRNLPLQRIVHRKHRKSAGYVEPDSPETTTHWDFCVLRIWTYAFSAMAKT